MKVPSSFFAYRASNFVHENLSTYTGDDADGNYDLHDIYSVYKRDTRLR